MKWKQIDKYPNCKFSEDGTILKTTSFDYIPSIIKQHTFMNGTINPSNLVEEITTGTCQIMEKKKIVNQYAGIEFKNSKSTTIINEKLIKHFIQKSSKYYLLGTNHPIIIKNKTHIVIIGACLPDSFIPVIE